MNAKTHYIISDLHLAEGDLGNGRSLGTENFFSDKEFSSMINHLIKSTDNKNCLIINGDFVDFIRITTIPKKESRHNFENWQAELDLIEANLKVDRNLTESEGKFGLKTNDSKSIWKLYLAIMGHKDLFKSLALWVLKGNELRINIGNHDPEWYWNNVQKYFKKKLLEIANSKSRQVNKDKFEGLISFETEYTTICNGQVRVEHGHEYESMTKLNGDFVWIPKTEEKPNKEQIKLPLGSFFNRYLINKVEFTFPHVDNLTTTKAIFESMLNEDLMKTAKLLGFALQYTVEMIKKSFSRLFWPIVKEILPNVILIGIPLFFFVKLLITKPEDYLECFNFLNWKTDIEPLDTLLFSARNIVIPYLVRLVLLSLAKLFGFGHRPLSYHAFKYMSENDKVSHMVMGHNHSPEYIIKGKNHYINTGSWTSKYVFKYGTIQAGVKRIVARIDHQDDNRISTSLLEWNDTTLSFKDHRSFELDRDF